MKNTLRTSRGITLVELLTVVVIVAVLTAIAVPSYRAYTIKTHRAAARACLSEAAQYMERFYTTNMTYEGAIIDLNCEQEGGLNRHYAISPGEPEQRAYTLTATPIGTQLSADAKCGTLSLTETGARDATGSAGRDICWN